LHELEKRQDEYTHRLASDVAAVISVYRERIPEFEWHAIQRALTIVQASLEVAQICEKTTNSHKWVDPDTIL
jgi:hypothetical protein